MAWIIINDIFFFFVCVVDPSALPNIPDSSWVNDGRTQWQWQVNSLAHAFEGTGEFGGRRGCGTCCWPKGECMTLSKVKCQCSVALCIIGYMHISTPLRQVTGSRTVFHYWSEGKRFGSLYVSGKLPTYPSPKPTLTLSSFFRANCWLRGRVGGQFFRFEDEDDHKYEI